MSMTSEIGHIKYLLLLLFLVLLPGCGGSSLDTLGGPESGKISGLICDDLEILTAAQEESVIRDAMLREDRCIKVSYSKEVEVVRTVMMPGDAKYSQILWPADGNKYWIKTSKIRASN